MSMAGGGFMEASHSGYGGGAAVSIAAAPDARLRTTNGWRRTSSKARTPQAVFHTRLPCFLEVLILRDFESLFPEVLILHDFKPLFPEVSILVEFKFMWMSEMREFF
jgi:hypothetical protein